MYRLDFTKDPQGVMELTAEERYAVCIQAVRTAQRAAPFEAWDDVIGLLKKLKSIGVESTTNGLKTYELLPEGGVIDLERGERTQLIDFVKSASWVVEFLEKARGTLKWIESLPESDTKSGPKLEPKRRSGS